MLHAVTRIRAGAAAALLTAATRRADLSCGDDELRGYVVFERQVDGEPLGESSDDDPETELDFLREVDEAARDANAAFEEHATLQHRAKKRAMDAANDDLDAKKRRLLDLVEEAE